MKIRDFIQRGRELYVQDLDKLLHTLGLNPATSDAGYWDHLLSAFSRMIHHTMRRIHDCVSGACDVASSEVIAKAINILIKIQGE